MTTKKTCKAKASASGERCKRKAVEDGYCKQHHKQMYPQAVDDVQAEEDMEGEFFDKKSASVVPADPAFIKFDIAKRIAHTLANSNLVPDAYRGRPNDVFVAINMGSELGMEPFQAIQSIAVIEGKPCLYGDGLIGVVRASNKCEWIEETLSEDGKLATCRTQRQGDPNPISASYSMDDAVQAGISTKNNWKKHPKRMLQMRARAYCLRDAYPDLLKGLGIVEERVDFETTPAPITEFALPEAEQPTPIEATPATVTLAQVERDINNATDMEGLLKAGQAAKGLQNTHDINTAKITYKRKRDILQVQETKR